MTPDNNDSEDWGLSRRNYVKGVGMAGLASAVGFSGSASGAVPDENIVDVGSGSYTTEIPDTSNLTFDEGGGYGSPPGEEYIYTTDNVTGPMPTNGWWNSVAFGPSRWYDEDGNPYGQGALVSLPDYASTSARGITIQNPTDWGGDTASADFVKMDYINSPKLTVSNSGTSSYADTRADGWGDWHARARWGDGTSTVMDATVVKGTPFTFLEFEGGGAELTFEIKDSQPDSVALADSSNIDVWADRGNVLGVTINGITGDNYSHHFGIFAPSGATFDGVGSNTLTSDLAGQGYMTVAALPDAETATLDLFEQYAYNFVRDTYVDYDYVQTDANGQPVSEVRSTFEYTVEQKPESTASGTLAGLLPHQWKHSDDPVTGYEYWTPRGTMKLLEGDSFQTTLKYPGILPFMPDEGTYDRSQLETFVDDQTSDDLWKEGVGTDTDTYFAGKDFDHHLRTIPMAQQVDHTAARDRSLDALRTRIGGWLTIEDTSYGTAEEEEVFYYDSTIGTIIGYNDGFGSAGNMNDHHFHQGYFVRAAAEIARHDQGWVDDYGDMVDILVRDYANWERPSGTPTDTTPAESPKDAYPRFRNFDPYSGHSYAGGFAMAGDGNNQESSSEAANSYAAMIRWAEFTGNDAMRDAAVYLYTHEIHSIWDYWFDPSDDSHPDDWGDNQAAAINGAPDYEYASITWSAGYDRNVFWGPQDPVEIYGINWLPIGGHSMYLGWDEQYAEANWQSMVDARQRAIDQGMSDHMSSVSAADEEFLAGWKTCAWVYRAFSDPQEAIDLMEAELPMPEAAHKSAYVYHSVHNLNGLGSIDTSVTADTTLYGVFDDGSSKTYVAYNPDAEDRTVTFSDGTTLDVPANSLKTSNGDVTPGLAPGVGGDGGSDPGDTTAPAAPTNLSGSSAGTSTIDLSWDAASDDDTGVAEYTVYVDGTAEQSVTSTSATVSGLSPDTTYTVAVTATDGAGNESDQSGSVEVTTDAESSGQGPYEGTPTALPGTLEAENYDTGGSGVAYSDTTAGNTGGAYRDDDVDIETASTGGYNVGWIVSGEWLEYTVDADAAGDYDVTAQVASNAGGGSVSLSVDGTQQLSTSFGATGGWQSWESVSLGTVSLSAGQQVLRVTADTGDFNLDNLTFEAAGDSTAPSTPAGLSSTGTTTSTVDLSWDAASDGGTGVAEYTVYVDGVVDQTVTDTSATVSNLSADTSYDLQVSATDGAGNESSLSSALTVTTDPESNQSAYNGPHAIPGTVQAEDFDTGGSGVAFNDSDAANNGGAYRETAVDVEGATEGGYNIGWTAADEWTEYTVQIDSAGTYDLNLRTASASGGGVVRVEVDGTDVTGSISTSGTGGWQSWTTDTVEGIDLPGGEHVLRLYVESGGVNINWLEFVAVGGSGTSLSGSTGEGWSATVTEVNADSDEFAFEPANAATWADVQFDDGSGWVGYSMDDSDGDGVFTHTRDTSGDGSSIDVRFVYDDGSTGQYVTEARTITF